MRELTDAMFQILKTLLTELAPELLPLVKDIVDDLIAKRDPTASIRHAEAQAVRVTLGLPVQ